jgi:hypothetical protein
MRVVMIPQAIIVVGTEDKILHEKYPSVNNNTLTPSGWPEQLQKDISADDVLAPMPCSEV